MASNTESGATQPTGATGPVRDLFDFRGSPDPLVRVKKLGFLSFQSTDPERLAAYYVDALRFALTERSGENIYLTTGEDHHCVVITPGEARAPTSIGFEIHGSLEDAASRLGDAGIKVENHTDHDPGIAASLSIEGPEGTLVCLYENQARVRQANASGITPTRLSHVATHVGDIEEVQAFYEDVLGFSWSDTIEDLFVFMRCSPVHHSVNFTPNPTHDGRHEGLNHVAYECRDLTHVRDVLDHLAKQGYSLSWGPGRHGPGHNIAAYHRDPDGNMVEISTELDLIFDEENGCYEPRPWHEDSPQRPKAWKRSLLAANSWGKEMTFS